MTVKAGQPPIVTNFAESGQANASGFATILSHMSALETRTAANEQGIAGLNAALTRLGEKTDAGFERLNRSLTDRARTPWAIIISGFVATIALSGALGNLALSPMRDNMTDLKAAIITVATNSRSELMEVRKEMKEELRDLRSVVVPRGEHDEKWRGFLAQRDHNLAKLAADNDRLQRQIDEIRNGYAADIKLRLAELERKRLN